ncbi:unnamed protein product [Prunus armeniaca]
MTTELVKTAEDAYVWHKLVGRSPGGRLGYDGCLVNQVILIGGVVGGEYLEPRLGCDRVEHDHLSLKGCSRRTDGGYRVYHACYC